MEVKNSGSCVDQVLSYTNAELVCLMRKYLLVTCMAHDNIYLCNRNTEIKLGNYYHINLVFTKSSPSQRFCRLFLRFIGCTPTKVTCQ